MQMTLPVREMRAALRPMRQGQPFDLNRMLAAWVGLGYEARRPGRGARAIQPARRHRGYLAAQPAQPVRIELFGDEVDSLRTFDPSTQRTLARVEQALVGPASEALPKLGERGSRRGCAGSTWRACHPPARNRVRARDRAARVRERVSATWNGTCPISTASLPACSTTCRRPALLVLDDAAELMAALADLEGQAEQLARDLATAGDVPPSATAPYFASADAAASA